MKHRGLIISSLGILAITVLVFSMSDEQPAKALLQNDVEINRGQTKQNLQASKGDQSQQPFPGDFSTQQALNTEAKIRQETTITSEPQAPADSSTLQQINAQLSATTDDLDLDAGLSDHNLMVLQDLASRLDSLINLQEDPPLSQQNFPEDWPPALRDALNRLTTAIRAEKALRHEWQDTLTQRPHEYRDAFLTQQKQILGTELYNELHAEDAMIIDEAGLSAHYASKEEAPELNSQAHQDKLALLKQWQTNQLSEAELKSAISDSLSTDEINQLIDTGLNEAQWLAQVEVFLDEYRYVQQSGITGEDELQMRHELIEKHFAPEDQHIVNQFLFNSGEQRSN